MKPKIPKEAIVKPEEEHPVQTTIRAEEVPSKEEKDYEELKAVDNDLDSDDNPDYDPAV